MSSKFYLLQIKFDKNRGGICVAREGGGGSHGRDTRGLCKILEKFSRTSH